MSKAKEAIAELRSKMFDNKKQEIVEKAVEVINETLSETTYDVIQDPSTKSRAFLIVKIQYDIKTKKAAVVEVKPFDDKAAGLTMNLDKQNRKYLFERNRNNGEKK